MTEKSPFPPIPWLWREYERAGAWYSGDEKRLRRCAPAASFWAGDEQIRLHVPVCADIAAMSAALIFSKSPEILCAHAPTRLRIEEIFRRAGVYGVLSRAAELASVHGGVFLKWSWQTEVGFPQLHAVPADCGLPIWENGRMKEIRLWTLVREEGGVHFRIEERYTPDGRIRTRLLKGTSGELGSEQPLGSIPETRALRPEARCGANVMLAFYVPNILPGRSHPELNFGRSDFDGLYGLFDALDEAYSALQRETRMTKTTVIVPAEYLRRRDDIFAPDAPEWVYANSGGAFTALDIDSDRSSSPITVVNPQIHAESRIALCEDLMRRILSLAGYAPQTGGLDAPNRSESGAALTVRERKSIRTSENKKNLWWQALQDILHAMLALDKNVFRSGVDPDAELSITLPDAIEPDLMQLSQIIERLGEALSVEAKVAMLHPDWSEDERAAEALRIRSGEAAPGGRAVSAPGAGES